MRKSPRRRSQTLKACLILNQKAPNIQGKYFIIYVVSIINRRRDIREDAAFTTHKKQRLKMEMKNLHGSEGKESVQSKLAEEEEKHPKITLPGSKVEPVIPLDNPNNM